MGLVSLNRENCISSYNSLLEITYMYIIFGNASFSNGDLKAVMSDRHM